jgi:hypothetical protein
MAAKASAVRMNLAENILGERAGISGSEKKMKCIAGFYRD